MQCISGLHNREVTVWQLPVLLSWQKERGNGRIHVKCWLDGQKFLHISDRREKNKTIKNYGHSRTFRSVHWANHRKHMTTMGYLQLKYDWCTNVSAYRMLLLVPYVCMYVCMSNKLPNWKPHVKWELQYSNFVLPRFCQHEIFSRPIQKFRVTAQ